MGRFVHFINVDKFGMFMAVRTDADTVNNFTPSDGSTASTEAIGWTFKI